MTEPNDLLPDDLLPDDLLPDPDEPVTIEPLEERPEVAAAIEDETTAPGLAVPGPVPADPDVPRFEEPEEPAAT